MFAVVRTGGKQYRVAPGDKIVVEKLDGNAGDKVTLGDVLLAGDGGDLKSTQGLTVAAEIVAQAKGDKVTVFKKRRRHNYRRKQGHRQLHTILKIVAIGDHKEPKKPAPSKAEGATPKSESKPPAAPKVESSPPSQAEETPAATAKSRAKTTSEEHQALEAAGAPTENPAPNNEKAAGAEKPAAKRAAPGKAGAKTASTKNAAPAKGAAKKSPKAK
jgi:large subunit ribosomal protein L21